MSRAQRIALDLGGLTMAAYLHHGRDLQALSGILIVVWAVLLFHDLGRPR